MVTALKIKRVTLTQLAQERLIAERNELATRLELASARAEASGLALAALVSILRRTGGYMSAVDQREYRAAEAILAELEGA